jgi:DNA-directed RNA polymerase subunit RPC12/RpoP
MSQQNLESGPRCPECLGRLPGSPGVGDALAEYGCVYCGADLAVDPPRHRR